MRTLTQALNFCTPKKPESEYRFIRVLPELRASQVADFDNGPSGGAAIYFAAHYDLQETKLPTGFHSVNLASAIGFVSRSSAETLEIPEPAWARMLPTTSLLAAVWTLSGLIKGKVRRARLYAIENNDPVAALLGRPLPRLLRWVISAPLGIFIRVFVERIAYGSPSAQEAYESLPFVAAVPHRLVLELPRASTKFELAKPARPTAIFLGRLESRKGIHNLLSSWPAVEEAVPEARLLIIGAGPQADVVQEWAGLSPASRQFLGQIAHGQIGASLDQAHAVVVPSQRDGRWREQIGLPIVEGLAQGLTVVTSDETGLAEWLSDHGHQVVRRSQLEVGLADAITAALTNPLDRQTVRNALPTQDGRLVAAHWLVS